jgi:hypothetical protein
MFEHGWIWMIPLRETVMSVSAVGGQASKPGPAVSRFLRSRYRLKRARCGAMMMVGDTFVFINPPFSNHAIDGDEQCRVWCRSTRSLA